MGKRKAAEGTYGCWDGLTGQLTLEQRSGGCGGPVTQLEKVLQAEGIGYVRPWISRMNSKEAGEERARAERWGEGEGPRAGGPL